VSEIADRTWVECLETNGLAVKGCVYFCLEAYDPPSIMGCDDHGAACTAKVLELAPIQDPYGMGYCAAFFRPAAAP
jgi:hypothetical protein